ncbi:MAG: C40 family peptidase [Chitinophagaceae bacterium]
MVKNILLTSIVLLSLSAFSDIKAQKKPAPNLKFIEDIEVAIDPASLQVVSSAKITVNQPGFSFPQKTSEFIKGVADIEKLSALQLKYALLLDTDVEQVDNHHLFALIDTWYGTPYRYGGVSKGGIDCSAFVQTLYAGIYGISLPRTAKEQHKATNEIARNELKEGDLLFFNTTGGVSHVGYYLQNNKFVHAASSEGVSISDMDDEYWAKRFLSAGRVEGVNSALLLSQP